MRKQISTSLEESIITDAKIMAVKKGVKLNDLIEAALQQYVEEKEREYAEADEALWENADVVAFRDSEGNDNFDMHMSEPSIKGSEKLSSEQLRLMQIVNKAHTACVGTDYKSGMQITEVWLEKGVVCVRLKNGDWYHYTKNGEWY